MFRPSFFFALCQLNQSHLIHSYYYDLKRADTKVGPYKYIFSDPN